MPRPTNRSLRELGLPEPVFLYSPEQVCQLLSMSHDMFTKKYMWAVGRHVGRPRPDRIKCINIAPVDENPDWRIEESELVRWMKFNKIKCFQRSYPLE
jgi:hypothetical protein